MASCFWEVLKGCIVDKVKSVYSLIKNHNSNLNQLHGMHRELLAKKDGIAWRVENCESRLEQVTNEARDWLQSAEKLLEDEQVKNLMNEDYIRAKDQCCFGLILCNLYERYGMSQLAMAKADEMQQKITGFPQEPVTHPTRTLDLEPMPTGHWRGLKTREGVEQRVLEMLKDDQVAAVGICGMGGIGKTTLAKEIQNKGAKDMFDLILLVEISQEANIRRIQDELAASLDLPLNSQLSLAERATWLYNALKKEKPKQSNKDEPTKMLIILDNIWKDLELHKLGILYPHEKTPQFCCKLLFTSRYMNVCRSMGVPDKNIVQVKTLNDDESKSLFWEKVGNNEDDDQGKRSLEHELLDSCGGLPLAITALAGMLRGKNVEMWKYYANQLQKPISCQSDSVYDANTYKILELSFNAIRNDEMKRFFLLVCLFPNGESTIITDLVRYGIGLDLFLKANFLTEALTEATMWAEELISSSLLLSERIDKNGFVWVKVHDVVRSYAISFTEKRGNRLIVEAIPQLQMDRIVQECTAIYIRDDEDFSWLKGMDFNRLEILLIWGSRKPRDLDGAFFKRMAHLKVLDSTHLNFIRLPKSMTNLTSLKTLQLDDCSWRDEDMELISELMELRVLSLRRSHVKMLPHGMTKLINLRLLDLTGCEELRTIPANVIGALTKLEELYMKNRYRSWQNSEQQESGEASLAELNSLCRLKVLEIDVPKIEQLQIIDDFFTTLHSFAIYVGNKRRYELEFWLSGKFMAKFECLEWVLRYPRLMERLCKSDYLKVDGKTIRDDDKGKDVVSYLNKGGFPNLKTLYLYNLKVLMRIYDERQVSPGMFSKLEHLSLHKLDNLESYVLPIDAAPNLTSLEVKDCKKLKFIWMDLDLDSEAAYAQGGKCKSSMAMKIKELPYLKQLRLAKLPQLQHVLGEAQGPTFTNFISSRVLFRKIIFPSLEGLDIEDSGDYVKLWDIPDTMEEMRASTQFSFCNQLQSLKKLRITGAHKLKALTPSIANALVQLRSLLIEDCSNMKEVISKETKETEISSKTIIFSQLTSLHLGYLDQLECFYRGSYELQFPALKWMSFIGFSNYKRLFVEQENSQGVFPKKIEFPWLKESSLRRGEWNMDDSMDDSVGYLDVEKGNLRQGLRHIFLANGVARGSLEGLRQLERLRIEDCKHIEAVTEIEPRGQQPQQEDAVVADNDDDGSGAGATISMPSSSSSSASLYLHFPRLRHIILKRCKNLRWFISTKTGTGTWHDHVNVVVDLPSLEYVCIEHCPKMEEFSSGPINLKTPNLSIVQVETHSTTFKMKKGEDINSFLRTIYTPCHEPQRCVC